MMPMGVLHGRAHAENRRDACNGALHYSFLTALHRGPYHDRSAYLSIANITLNCRAKRTALVVLDRGVIPTDKPDGNSAS